MFVNDLTSHVEIASIFQFSDDISADVADNNRASLSQRAKPTRVASKVDQWSENNVLNLNVGKTALVVYKSEVNESLYVKLGGKQVS